MIFLHHRACEEQTLRCVEKVSELCKRENTINREFFKKSFSVNDALTLSTAWNGETPTHSPPKELALKELI